MKQESIETWFSQTAAAFPDEIAISSSGILISYSELDQRSNHLAHLLVSAGISTGEPVAILADEAVTQITAILGILKAGGAFVPLDATLPEKRLQRMMEIVEPGMMIVEAQHIERAASLLQSQSSQRDVIESGSNVSSADTRKPVKVIMMQDVRVVSAPEEASTHTPYLQLIDPQQLLGSEGAAHVNNATPEIERDEDRLAYIYFTSGSTGTPKAIAGRLKAIDHFIRWEINRLSLSAGVRVSQLLPINFDGSLRDIFVPLCSGGRVCVPPGREIIMDTGRLVEWLDKEGINVVHCVPSLFRAIVNEGLDTERLQSLQFILMSGEVLLPADVKRWMEVYGDRVQLVNLYGPTETTLVKFNYFVKAEDAERRSIPIGKPMDGAKALLINEKGKPCPPGMIGEIYIRTPYRSLGYYRQPEMTAEVFIQNPYSKDERDIIYKTGDLGRQLEDGNYEYIGRRDQQVKVRGQRVELGEVEEMIRQHQSVRDLAVVERIDDTGYNYLCAYVVLSDGSVVGELWEHLRAQLPEYMVPAAIVVLEELPRTISGKVDRRALPAPAQSRSGLEQSYVAPRTPIEEILTGIWSEVLGVEQVGIHDNFFELGGHSLLATRLLSRARAAFSTELPLRALFESPTVAALAAHVETSLRSSHALDIPPLRRVERESNLPLSFAQQRLWFIDQLEPHSSTYNIASAVRLSGSLNVTALERALSEVITRHETLRTTFPTVDSQPVQLIAEPTPFSLPIVDLCALETEDERQTEVQRLAREEARRPFDLTMGPLFRATLLKVEAEEHIALVTMHHIISDGWSIGILIREVAALYAAFSRGEASRLAPLAIQYADYAAWQREWLQGDVLEQQLSYWREHLADAPPVLELPSDHPRPPVQSFRGARHRFSLNGELTQALTALSRREGATLFMTLLAAFKTLLYRYSEQESIVVGTPIAGRTEVETEELIGFFVNTLVLRTEINAEMSVREVIERVKEAALGGYGHQEVPFEKLVEEIAPERSLSHTPLFQVAFVLQNASFNPTEVAGVEFGGVAVQNITAKFDVTMAITEAEGGLRGGIEYNTDLFEPSTIERMAGHFERILRSMVERPEQRVGEIEMLTMDEQHQLLVEWNQTDAYHPELCVHEMFEAQVERTPDTVAVVFEDEEISYQELNRRANKVAHYLRETGVGAESLVAVMMERSVEMVVALLGVLKAGGAYVPIDPEYPQERVRYMLEDSGARVLLTEAKLAESGKEGLARVVCVDSEWERIAEYSDENVESGAEPGNLAYVIYTSGSTGEPKGTLIPHFNVVRLFEATRDWFQFDEKDVWTLFHSYGFDFSVWEMWGALLHGGRLVVVPRWVSRSPEVFYDMLATHRVTVLNQTPSAFYQLIQAEQSGNASPELALRMVIFGGEALDIQRLKPWIDNHGDRAPQLVNMYGITETTVHVTYRPLTVADVEVARSSLIGGSLPDLLLYILDRRMRLVPIGVPGELCVGGAGLSRGYLNRADLTAEKFIPDPFSHQPGACLYKSGDLARRLPDGDIEYLGRIDHQVKIRGFRIELGEIESVLKQHPHVREVVVMYRADVQGEHRLVCYVVGDQSQTVTTSDLYDFSSSRLPDYMVPSAFVMLDGLPLTANGKVDRRALPAPSQTRPELQESFVAPRTLVEEILAGIWADILSLSQVGIHDNFFELGGHSLLATQVVSRLRHAFSTELPLRTLFESPTVAALAAHVETSLRSLHASDIPPLRRVARENNLPLSFAQQRLWFIDQLEPYSSTYNIASALRLSGSLDVKALERALSEVITRHETLQTTFPTVDSQPVQLIAEPAPFLLPVVDLLQQMNDASADERQREATRLAQEEAQRPFDLSTGPLFRATLLKVEAEEHIALVTMHHIISDGWSIGILIREVATLYAAFSRGEASRLAPLAIQYADYAAWQREWLQGDVLEQQLSYWREHLAGAPPVLELPTDHPRPPVQSFRGARHRFSLNGELTQALTALSRREGATLFMTLLAAFKTLLYRYSEQESIVVGTPIAGRTEVETEELIGFFVNTLVLRTEINAEMSVREVIERVKEGALGGYGHQEVPFEKLVEEMAPERSLSHTPLFQVMFVMQNEPRTELEMSGVGVSAVGTQSGTAKFDVTMAITEAEGGLRGGIEYNTDIYEAETIERMAGHFERILESMVERPEQRVGEIEMLTEDEQHQLLVEWNETEQPLPTLLSVATLFEAQVERTPDAVAVVFEDEHLTYKELNGRANLLAHHLRAQGVGCESLVALSLPRSSELIVVLIGILKAGGAYLPLDAEYPQERLSFMLRDAAPSLLLTKRALLPAFASHDIPVVCIDDVANERANDKSVDNLPCVTNGDNLAYVMYTSGSTGQPKGTAVTHRNVVRLVYQARYAVMDSKQVFLQFAPISFDASTFEIWGCLLNGGRLVVMASEKPSLEELGRVISQTGVTTLWLTAGLFHLMVDERLEDLSKVEQLLAGGDVLSASHVRRYIEASRGRRLINGYGPTESTTFACCYEMTEATGIGETVPIGRPINNTKAYVLDRNLRMVARGVVGELYLGGAGVARGYLHRPELTAERFVPDPFAREAGARLYRTGDRVRVLADGNIEYLGRRDGQVKVRGFRIELGEIEAVLAEHDSVREAVVVAGEGTGGGTDKRLVAYVVGARAEGINVGVLRGYVEGRLPQYMVPSVFVEMESLPLTPNGKVDRRALPEPEQSRPELESSFVAPETELEQIIAGIWREVLEVERVGVHDGFFDLGGHSLLLAQAHSRLRNTLNRDISMVDLFKYPTISALAKYLSEEKDSTDEQNVAEDATAGDERGELRREAKERQAQSRRKRQEMRKQKEGQDEQARHV